jgi:hypothetical protein
MKIDLKERVTAGTSDDQILQIVHHHSDTYMPGKIANFDEINTLFYPDSGVNILERAKQSTTPFGQETYKSLTSKSPLSLAIIFEQI